MDELREFRAASLARLKTRLEASQVKLDGLDRSFFWARLLTLLAGGAASLLALIYGQGGFGLLVLALFIALFTGVVVLHRRVDRAHRRIQRSLNLVSAQRARMQLDWPSVPAEQPVGVAPEHPFSSDLDLVGSRSLHQLVDTAASYGGSNRLADWLLNPVLDPGLILARQGLVKELLPLHGFRWRLAMEGESIKDEAGGRWDGETLLRWLNANPGGRSLVPILSVLLVLAAANIFLYAGYALAGLPAIWLFSLSLYAALYLYNYKAYKDLFGDAYTLGKALDQFRMILSTLEGYPYPEGSRLAGLCAAFRKPGQRPSRFLQGIVWITSAAGLENNPILSLALNTLVPWNFIFAYLLNRYKDALRATLPIWLNTWYEIEALCSLSNLLYLNPGYTFPQIEEKQPVPGEITFEARQVGHPLLSEAEKVRNDFKISKLGEVALITGSNMSGKSTFLRTLGINLCLAFAGGPVNAQQLRTGLFRLFTCIQVNDSLSNGISYFYAEVRRLKALLQGLEGSQHYPLFFLIDEIFRGTNNRERQIGSRAYVRALTQGYGAGAISTHDLELVKLAEMELPIVNYHFREDIRDGLMAFDYRLRAGPCPTTNALKIMALEGLPVEPL